MPRKTVAVDFDGVIHSYTSPFSQTEFDAVEPGALAFVQELLHGGYDVVIYSTRASSAQGRKLIMRYLADNGFPVRRISITSDKPPAVAYVDDRAVSYDRTSEGGWAAVREAVDWLADNGPHAGDP